MSIVDGILIILASGTFSLLVALGVVKVWRAFSTAPVYRPRRK